MFKVIDTDNYDGDHPDEHVISMTDHEGKSCPLTFNTKEDAQVIANAFNQINYRGSTRFFAVADSTYKLRGPFEP